MTLGPSQTASWQVVSALQDNLLQRKWARFQRLPPSDRNSVLRGVLRLENALFSTVYMPANAVLDGPFFDRSPAEACEDLLKGREESAITILGQGTSLDDDFEQMLVPPSTADVRPPFYFSSALDDEIVSALAKALENAPSSQLSNLSLREALLRSIGGPGFTASLFERFGMWSEAVLRQRVRRFMWPRNEEAVKLAEVEQAQYLDMIAWCNHTSVRHLMLTAKSSIESRHEWLPFCRSRMALQHQYLRRLAASVEEQHQLDWVLETYERFVRCFRAKSIGAVLWPGRFLTALDPDSMSALAPDLQRLLLRIAQLNSQSYWQVLDSLNARRNDFLSGLLSAHDYVDPIADAAAHADVIACDQDVDVKFRSPGAGIRCIAVGLGAVTGGFLGHALGGQIGALVGSGVGSGSAVILETAAGEMMSHIGPLLGEMWLDDTSRRRERLRRRFRSLLAESMPRPESSATSMT